VDSEKRRKAIALRYDPDQDDVPRVVAEGQGRIAEKILALAAEHGVPVHEDPLLVESLAALEVGDFIPPECYPVVAEILVFVQRMNREKGASGR
jgi:flagellar biosynthesis protein